MPRDRQITTVRGEIEEILPGLLCRVVIPSGASGEERRTILAHLAGKMRIHRIRVVRGDAVLVEMPDALGERGRIVRRL
ncbi:hypothetical protein A2110_00910 [Candidatus Jorgensenbacteria bacterium GWA1_54_12]|uniref:S1-like domain-containing protein n=1 Tax=Candidatus Jorgensenbacteria bacterium GWA1_54_12 TaxID=1798468 RepID=A0A1F6BL77_9BACT|nr:MAG: hypothetical protein A2110_00910 [Candidatus Jorgensenbacteria bacterium GWA1_54_12]